MVNVSQGYFGKEALEERQCPGIKFVLNKSLCHTYNFCSVVRITKIWLDAFPHKYTQIEKTHLGARAVKQNSNDLLSQSGRLVTLKVGTLQLRRDRASCGVPLAAVFLPLLPLLSAAPLLVGCHSSDSDYCNIAREIWRRSGIKRLGKRK